MACIVAGHLEVKSGDASGDAPEPSLLTAATSPLERNRTSLESCDGMPSTLADWKMQMARLKKLIAAYLALSLVPLGQLVAQDKPKPCSEVTVTNDSKLLRSSMAVQYSPA
jgi:hypothetical protein